MSEPIIAVFDTNVLVSALLSKSGAPAALMELWAKERFLLATSEAILAEVARVLQYPKIEKRPMVRVRSEEFLQNLRRAQIITEDLFIVEKVPEDLTDNIFLACALETGADYLVTGDILLRNLKEFYYTRIVNPRQFLDWLTQK
jgi:putative PIN family toxin of toxin-antitoxin system